jgi:hypothetical protein
VLEPYNIKSPACIVPGFEALVVRLLGKSKYFSLLFKSVMLSVSGNLALKAFTVALLKSVAVKVFVPTVILSFILLVSKVLFELVVISSLLLQAKSLMQIKKANNVITGFILFRLY